MAKIMKKAQDGYMAKIKKSAASDTSTKKGMNFDKKSFDSLPKLPMKKAKSGGSFPDLNKDGKITKADILKGRGVIAKNGMKMKKQAATAIAMKKASKAPKAMMKMGGKCKNGC